LIRADAVVIGGGPAGASAAIFLSEAGWDVHLVERSDFPRRKVCGEFISATTFHLVNELGVALSLNGHIGPPIRRIGIFGRKQRYVGPESAAALGMVIPRARLDSVLLETAIARGVTVWQPWKAIALNGSRVTLRQGESVVEIDARTVIAAHGSWEVGSFPTQSEREKRPDDLLAFKFLFRNSGLDRDTMPLIAFPGGYGGMAFVSEASLGLSCCIRRDILARERARRNLPAAKAALGYLISQSLPAAEVLDSSEECEEPLAAGPIRPGIRHPSRLGVFCVGNVAGEAHPIIAEGISMAIQGARLLADHLAADTGDLYWHAWRRQFGGRIRFASALAHLAMLPAGGDWMSSSARMFPVTLKIGTSMAGKPQDWDRTRCC
jgi:flavin-dependent dehydrogenase